MMRRIRDGPGQKNAAKRAAFFVRKKESPFITEDNCMPDEKTNDVVEIRKMLFQKFVDDRRVMTPEQASKINEEIVEVLNNRTLIWKNGVLYHSWAECLGDRGTDVKKL